MFHCSNCDRLFQLHPHEKNFTTPLCAPRFFLESEKHHPARRVTTKWVSIPNYNVKNGGIYPWGIDRDRKKSEKHHHQCLCPRGIDPHFVVPLRAGWCFSDSKKNLGRKGGVVKIFSWDEVEKHIDMAMVMINSNMVQESGFHLTRSLSQVTGIAQRSMSVLKDEGIL